MKKYFESVGLLYRLRKLMGFPLWKRPRFFDRDDWEELWDSVLSVIAGIVFLLIWPVVWLLNPLQPFWLAALKPHENIRRAVEKWEKDLAARRKP